MSHRRVLLISYYFPPLGGAGIGRPLALFRHLNEFGYECHVLTVKPVLYRVYEPELLYGLEKSKIFRSGSWDPSRLAHLLGVRRVTTKTADQSRKITKSFFPDAKTGWIGPAIRLGKKLCHRNKYDLIISTSPPISAHVVAKEIHISLKIPWVADFTDFWVSLKAENHFDSELKVAKAKNLLAEIKSSADLVVAVNESCGEYVGAEQIISNCYDSDLAKLWNPLADAATFTIGVFGTLSDLTPIEPLLRVLQYVREKWKPVFDKLKVLQVGQVDVHWLNRQLESYKIQDKFEVKQFQNRSLAIQLLSRSSLFYLGISRDQGKGITPGRIFSLLASGRPILAYAPPESEIDKIISKASNSFRFEDKSLDQASEFLSRQVDKWSSGEVRFATEPDYAKEYSSKNMVRKFANLFDKLVASR